MINLVGTKAQQGQIERTKKKKIIKSRNNEIKSRNYQIKVVITRRDLKSRNFKRKSRNNEIFSRIYDLLTI